MHEIYLSYEKVLNLKDDTFERGVISTFYNGKELQDGKRLDWYDTARDSTIQRLPGSIL